MMPIKEKDVDVPIPAEGAQLYIAQMLRELALIAHESGLKELASLLKATVAASLVDLSLETEF